MATLFLTLGKPSPQILYGIDRVDRSGKHGLPQGINPLFRRRQWFCRSERPADTPDEVRNEAGTNELVCRATMATPVEGLKLGLDLHDYLDSRSGSGVSKQVGTNTVITATGHDAWAASIYASYQATEKLSLHARGELLHDA